MSKPPIVAVTGGKGGVGKTTVAVGLALAFIKRGLSALLVDADVDNPNCHELLGVSVEKLADVTSFLPAIDESRCTGCGICVGICPDFALLIKPGEAPKVVESRCSGCMACSFACQVGAIIRSTKVLGELFTAARANLRLIGGKLKPGEARSPLVVDALLKRAMAKRSDYDVLVIDSAPGLGNAVVRALRVADLAVVVTEPTPLGLNTLRLTALALERIGKPYFVVINRSDISPSFYRKIAESFSIAAEIPYDRLVVEVGARRTHMLNEDQNHPMSRALLELSEKILTLSLRNSD